MIELPPGAAFGPYRVTRKLGSGGMGAVYAVQGPEGQELALKLLDLSQADEESAQRFQREAESHARVDRHPNVARIHGSGVVGEQPYLVMDLLPGGDLAARLVRGPLSSDEVRELGIALAEGLAHIHARGVLHRDLKPANVLFDEAGRPRLTDFGLARPVEATSLTQSGTILGTPGYMAPEQASAGEVSPATDVFGLGATLYAALTGRAPFGGSSLFATLDLLLREPPPPLPKHVPAGLRAAIERALEKDPQARFPDARSFREALVSGKGAPGRPLVLGALALAGLALLGLGATWALGAFDSAPVPLPPSPAPIPRLSASPARAPAEWPSSGLLILHPGRGDLAKRPARVVAGAWIAEDRFATMADNGLLTTWQPGPGGVPLAERRFTKGIEVRAFEVPVAFSPRPGWLAWAAPWSPLQFSALSAEEPVLTLGPAARAILRDGEGYLLLSTRGAARWLPAQGRLDWEHEHDPPEEAWELQGAERSGPNEVLLVWWASAKAERGRGGTIFERATVGAKGLTERERVQSADFICRTTYLEGESLFVGSTSGGLLVLNLRDLKVVDGIGLKQASTNRAHSSPIYGIGRGPEGTLVSLGGGQVRAFGAAAPGDLRLWSPSGEALGHLDLSKLARCKRLEISANRRHALIIGQTRVALVPLEPLLRPTSR